MKEMHVVSLAARLLQTQYGFYARPLRDVNGRPMLLVWGGSRRDEVDLALPDHRIALGRSGLTWLMDGTVIMGTLAGGKSLADHVASVMLKGGVDWIDKV